MPDLTNGRRFDWENENCAASSHSSLLTGCTKFKPLPYIRTILITGGAGFIGSWVTRHLSVQYKDDYQIICFDKLDMVSSLKNIDPLFALPNFSFVKGDVGSAADVLAVLETYNVDCILHFAAYSHVDDSFGNPVAFESNNATATLVLLETVRKYGKIRRLIHVSTDEVYGGTNGTIVDEGDKLRPTNPYSASKAGAEMHVTAYHASFGIPIITARSNNVYGPHQYPQKIIPNFIKRAIAGEKLMLHGDGRNARCYVFAADVADAFDTLLHRGVVGEVYNIGSKDRLENREVAAKVLAVFGRYTDTSNLSEHLEWVADRPFNDDDYSVDDKKIHDIGWTQKTTFEQGLVITARWYEEIDMGWWT